MKWLRGLLVAALCFAPVGAEAWWQSIQQKGVGGAPAYQGPGDIVSGAFAWSGLRAYNSAKRGTKVVNVCNVADVVCADLSSDATTGQLVISTIGGSSCSVVVCTIKIWYDQSGATNCGGAVCDYTQATIANRPTLIVSCINSLPCARFNGSGTSMASPTGIGSLAATMTVSSVSSRTAAFTTTQTIFSAGDGTSNINVNYRQVASAIQMFFGSAGQFISNITDNNFHVVNAVFNGASSVLFCGGTTGTSCSAAGTSNAISPGSVATGATNANMCIGFNSGGSATCGGGGVLSGDLTEVGMWTSVFNGTQQTNMNANQYAFWGPF